MSTQQEFFDYNSDGITDLINTYTFDTNNALTSLAIDYNADGESDITYTYAYDTTGNLTSELTSFSIFGESGNNPINTNINGNSTTTPLSYNVSTESDFFESNITTSIDDADGLRARVSVSYIDDGVISNRVDISVTNEKGQLSNSFSTRGLLRSFFYDDNGRLETQIDGFVDNPGVTVTFAYDAFGNLASESYDYEPDGIIDDVFTYIENSDAIDDAVATVEDSVLTGDVFTDNGNGADSGSNGDALSVIEVNGLSSEVGNQITLASGALLTLNSDGTFTYDPNGQFNELSDGESTTDSFTYTADSGNGLSDTATVTVTINGADEAAPDTAFWFSPHKDGVEGEAEDIIFFDGSDFKTFFDGSDVGLNARIDAFDIISETEILMSFHRDITLNGLAIDDSDVVKFTAESLGEAGTAGSFERYLTGSELGLTKGSEDIDALIGMEDGSLLFSTTGNAHMTGNLRSKDEDLVRFDPLTGALSIYLDGSDVGLGNRREDVNAIGMLDGDLILSTAGDFDVRTVAGKNEDAVRYTPTSIGAQTSGVFGPDLFFDGSTAGFSGDIAAIDLNIG